MTLSDAEQLERAARIMARQFGYGSGWLAVCIDARHSRDPDDTPTASDGALSIALRGLAPSQRRELAGLREWKSQRGRLTVPATSAPVDAAAALSFAQLNRWEVDLLLVFGCEDWGAWLRIEPLLYRARCTPNAPAAIRDAMARILYRRAGASTEARAKQLRVRASDYRAETRDAETLLRALLLAAARALNQGSAEAKPGVPQRPGPSIHPLSARSK